jgi:hypothetical protein
LLWDSHFQMMNPFTYSSHRALMPKTLMLIEFIRLSIILDSFESLDILAGKNDV